MGIRGTIGVLARGRPAQLGHMAKENAFLSSFVERIEVGAGEMTVKYTIPVVDGQGENEMVGVLPYVQNGSPKKMKGKALEKTFAFVW